MARPPYQSHAMLNNICSFVEHPLSQNINAGCSFKLSDDIQQPNTVECVATHRTNRPIASLNKFYVLVPEFTILNGMEALYSSDTKFEPQVLVHYIRLELVHCG